MQIYMYPQQASNYAFSVANTVNLTPFISDVETQLRSDDAFAIGTFRVIIPSTLFANAKYNIPPFTVFEICTGNQGLMSGKRWFGYSKCSKYLRTQGSTTYYTHDITLIEPIAILETIQIGCKTFTNHTDYNYLMYLKTIIQNTTGIQISFTGRYNVAEQHSFSFDKGTTAFEIINEIFKIHNYKINFRFADQDSYVYWFRFEISPIRLEDDPLLEIESDVETIAINTNYLTLAEYNQSQDNYCKYLESQVDNVVDRNTLTTWSNLSVRSDDSTCTSDNCYIELPSKVESVNSLYVSCEPTETIKIEICQADKDDLTEAFGSGPYTWEQLISAISWLGTFATNLIANNTSIDLASFSFVCNEIGTNSHTSDSYQSVNYIIWRVVGTYNGLSGNRWVDISKCCLDSSVYQALPASDQPCYCYYTNGGDKIEGIYKYYRDDWVSSLIGNNTDPMLKNLNTMLSFEGYTDHIIGNDENEKGVFGFFYYKFEFSGNANPINYLFKATARPITNQYVKDTKSTSNIVNSGLYIGTSRSYGNSANFIDYDVMKKNISIANSQLGTPELTLQFINNCDLTRNSKFTYDSKTWFTKSVIMNVFRDKILYTVNAATNYNKQADCIGVRTQYQSTKIALDNIKERHLYYENNSSTAFDSEHTYYLNLTFTYIDDSTKSFLIRTNIYYNENTGLTLTANMPDNYSAGKYLASGDSSSRFIQKDASYVDENGEAYKISGSVVFTRADEMTIAQSRYLPKVPNNLTLSTELTFVTDQVIYKDEHESLAITLYLPNATYS